MFHHVFQPEGSQQESSSRCYMVETFLNAATFSKDHEGCNYKSMSFEDFKNWCTLVPSVKKFLSNLLVRPDSGTLLHSRNLRVPIRSLSTLLKQQSYPLPSSCRTIPDSFGTLVLELHVVRYN